jgi:hypothetical protein
MSVRQDKYLYSGQLNPNWRNDLKSILNEQQDEIIGLEKGYSKDSLPKEYLILMGGVVVMVIGILIYKNRK